MHKGDPIWPNTHVKNPTAELSPKSVHLKIFEEIPLVALFSLVMGPDGRWWIW